MSFRKKIRFFLDKKSINLTIKTSVDNLTVEE